MTTNRSIFILLIYTSLAAVAFLIGYMYDNLTIWIYPDVSINYNIIEQILIGLLIGGAISSGFIIIEQHNKWMRLVSEFLGVMVGGFGSVELILLIIIGSAAEELMFRGALQPAIGIILQAALFAMLHTGPTKIALFMLPWTLSAFVSGIIFGVLFQSTGTIIAPITAHMVINLISIIRLKIRYQTKPLRTPNEIIEKWKNPK